jgi:hypothetical protein
MMCENVDRVRLLVLSFCQSIVCRRRIHYRTRLFVASRLLTNRHEKAQWQHCYSSEQSRLTTSVGMSTEITHERRFTIGHARSVSIFIGVVTMLMIDRRWNSTGSISYIRRRQFFRQDTSS